jgi:RND family efflux transporter MFP subunit
LRRIVLIVVLSALGIGGWYFYRHGNDTGRLRDGGPGEAAAPAGGGNRIPGLIGGGGAVNVVLAPVETDDAGETVVALGTAEAAQSVILYPQVSGIVTEILFAPGEQVAAGEPLLRLEADEQEVAVERARIELAQAREALRRARELEASRTISAVALSDAETAVQLAEVELRAAEIALFRRTIAAPFAGITGLTDLSVGDLVSNSTEITTLEDLSTIRVAFEAPERFAPRIRLGQPIVANGQGVAGFAATGRISGIDNRIDEATRTLKLEAELENPEGQLKTGMAVNVSLSLPAASDLSVPTLAVQWDRDGSFVWKAVGGVARRTAVAIVRRKSGFVTVEGDLSPGDRVVVEGVQRLREGARLAEVDMVPAIVGPASGAPPAADARGAPAAPSRS